MSVPQCAPWIVPSHLIEKLVNGNTTSGYIIYLLKWNASRMIEVRRRGETLLHINPCNGSPYIIFPRRWGMVFISMRSKGIYDWEWIVSDKSAEIHMRFRTRTVRDESPSQAGYGLRDAIPDTLKQPRGFGFNYTGPRWGAFLANWNRWKVLARYQGRAVKRPVHTSNMEKQRVV